MLNLEDKKLEQNHEQHEDVYIPTCLVPDFLLYLFVRYTFDLLIVSMTTRTSIIINIIPL